MKAMASYWSLSCYSPVNIESLTGGGKAEIAPAVSALISLSHPQGYNFGALIPTTWKMFGPLKA